MKRYSDFEALLVAKERKVEKLHIVSLVMLPIYLVITITAFLNFDANSELAFALLIFSNILLLFSRYILFLSKLECVEIIEQLKLRE